MPLIIKVPLKINKESTNTIRYKWTMNMNKCFKKKYKCNMANKHVRGC